MSPSPESNCETHLGDESMSSYTKIPNLIKRDKLKDYALPEMTQDLTALKINENASLCWMLNPPTLEVDDPNPPMEIARSAALNTAVGNYVTVFTATAKTIVHVVTVEHLDPAQTGGATLWLKRDGTRYLLGHTTLVSKATDIWRALLLQRVILDTDDILEVLPIEDAFSSTYVNVFYSKVV